MPVEMNGLAAMIAAVIHTNAGRIASGLGAIKAVMFLALIEALTLLEMAMRANEVEADANVTSIVAPTKARSSSRKSATSGTRAYYPQRLEHEHPALAKRVHDGELSVYRACIVAGLRKPAKDWSKLEAYRIRAREISA